MDELKETIEALNKAQVTENVMNRHFANLYLFRLILPSWRLTLELACLELSVEHPSQKWQKPWKTWQTSLLHLT